jgi:3-isopropylmalate dehydratase small subunit
MHIRDPILLTRVLDAITPRQWLRVMLFANLPYHDLQSTDTPCSDSFSALKEAGQGGLVLLAQCGDSNHSNNSSRNIAPLGRVPLWALGLSISAASELPPAEALPVLECL